MALINDLRENYLPTIVLAQTLNNIPRENLIAIIVNMIEESLLSEQWRIILSTRPEWSTDRLAFYVAADVDNNIPSLEGLANILFTIGINIYNN